MNQTENAEKTQPLDRLMDSWGLTSHDLVELSVAEQLSYKQVQKARTSTGLTLHLRMKMTRIFNVAIWGNLTPPERENFLEYGHKHLFNYSKNYDESWLDPNILIAEAVKFRKNC